MTILFLVSVFLAVNPSLGALSNANQLASSSSASNGFVRANEASLVALAADLQSADSRTRLLAVRELGLSSSPESKRLLADHLMLMPQPEPSGHSSQAEKAE